MSGDPAQLRFKVEIHVQEKIHVHVASDDDVLFFWEIMSAGWEVEESQALLKLIAVHYITFHGFSLVLTNLQEVYRLKESFNS